MIRGLLHELLSRYTFQCRTVWQDDDGYRTMPESEKEFFYRLLGRNVSLDEFFVATGGLADGRASIPTAMIHEAVEHIISEAKSESTTAALAPESE